MVLFLNVVVGQYVEIRHKRQVICGHVRYKGHLNGECGEWLGVELEYPLGVHNGCFRGRQYFKCPRNCGLFTHASNIRYRKADRRSRDNYNKLSSSSSVDESLFQRKHEGNVSQCYSISSDYLIKAKSGFSEECDMYQPMPRCPKKHSVGGVIPAASTLNPRKSQLLSASYKSKPVHEEYVERYEPQFKPANPSIPHYKMPHTALKRQMLRGGENWEEFGLHRPRFISV